MNNIDLKYETQIMKERIENCIDRNILSAKRTFERTEPIKYVDISAIDNESNVVTGYTNYIFAEAPSRAQQVIKKNDVLVSTVRPNLRNIAINLLEEENLVASSGFCILRANDNCYPKYLFYSVLADNFTERMVSLTTGANYPAVKDTDVLSFNIPLPSLLEQQKIANELDTIKKAIDNKKQQLSLLDEAVKSEFVEMFGENPVESGKWKVERLQSLSKSGGAYGAQSASSEYKKNRPRYIRITDINEDGSLNNDMVCSSNNDDDTTYKLVKGDFLFARMGATVGKTYAYSSGDMIFAGYLIRFQLNTEKIDPSFLFYFTKTGWYQKWVKNNQSGAAQPGINSNKYGNLLVPVPPLDLQIKFAAFVQQIDKSKFVVKQQIADLQELLDSKMQEYFA